MAAAPVGAPAADHQEARQEAHPVVVQEVRPDHPDHRGHLEARDHLEAPGVPPGVPPAAQGALAVPAHRVAEAVPVQALPVRGVVAARVVAVGAVRVGLAAAVKQVCRVVAFRPRRLFV